MRSLAFVLVSAAAVACSGGGEAPAAADGADVSEGEADAPPAPPTPAPVEDPDAVPADDPPSAAAPTTLRIMSFNIKNGEIAGHDLAALTAPLLPSNPDVLALQEVDEGTARSGGLAETTEIAKHMKMPFAYFGKNFAYDGGAYGLALISKLPMSNAHVIRLDDHTSRGNGIEPRIAVAADIALGGDRTITVVSVHASLKAGERAGNAARILADLGPKASRAIVMGDMNEDPGEAISDAMTAAGFVDAFHERHPNASGFTIPAGTPTRRIDLLFKGGAFGATVHAWVPDVTTSDHRPVAAVVTLPK